MDNSCLGISTCGGCHPDCPVNRPRPEPKPCSKCFICNYPMAENKCGKFMKEINQLFDDTHTKQSVDIAIRFLAGAIIDSIGWADVLDQLTILNQSKGREANGKEWSAMEWVGAHLYSVLEDLVHDDALAEDRCPNDGRELEAKIEKQTRDYPGREWLECPLCHEEYVEGENK